MATVCEDRGSLTFRRLEAGSMRFYDWRVGGCGVIGDQFIHEFNVSKDLTLEGAGVG